MPGDFSLCLIPVTPKLTVLHIMRYSIIISALIAAAASVNAILDGCYDADWDSETDFFPTKYVTTGVNLPSSITYNNTWVSMHNRQRRSVVLYFRVPVTKVAALDGVSQNIITLLGMSESIARVGTTESLTSSCIRGNVKDNVTYDQENWDKADQVDVTFFGHPAEGNTSMVYIKQDGYHTTLQQAAYIKFIGLFYGLEDLAVEVYDAIAANYRCAAANVYNAIMAGEFPQGRWISAVNYDYDTGMFGIDQNSWWKVLATDLGVQLVNVSSEAVAPASLFNDSYYDMEVSTSDSIFSTQSWAIIDTTQYAFDLGIDKVNKSTWLELTSIPDSVYAVENGNVFMADKSINHWRKHNFVDRAPVRPDIFLHDLISIIYPSIIPADYTPSFVRSINNASDSLAQRRMSSTCYPSDVAVAMLNLTTCELPNFAYGYDNAGFVADAYEDSDSEITSEALGTTISSSSGSDGSSTSSTSMTSSGLTAGQGAGIAVGAMCGAFFVIGAVMFLIRKKRRSSNLISAAEKALERKASLNSGAGSENTAREA
ncbi:periplasmic binding protein [Lipomyces tetrasporus]|uniref:Periplasmic binding protein n=1 Tax=Lipomyces tetrasporus TaxID=54092 RepID=A0AAD7QL41_9ASCO|nr:periplasmic binding protein [Lipomyces tetrasporus]KAJ8097295.1 periplasmic binding protein [Lipomyces tetrasporus]